MNRKVIILMWESLVSAEAFAIRTICINLQGISSVPLRSGEMIVHFHRIAHGVSA